MSITWIDYLAGETLASIRSKINFFNNSVVTDVNKNTIDIGNANSSIATNTADIVTANNSIDTNTADIGTINSTLDTFSTLGGQTTPSYNLTAVHQPIVGFTTTYAGTNMGSSLLNGSITVDNSGWYEVTYTGDLTFVSSTSTRFITLELHDSTATIAASVINIPRDAIRDTESVSMSLYITGGKSYNIEISSSEAMTITFNAINYTIKKLGL